MGESAYFLRSCCHQRAFALWLAHLKGDAAANAWRAALCVGMDTKNPGGS